MKLLRLSRCLLAASLALAIVAIATQQASASLVLSGNTHPRDTNNINNAQGVVAYAVYQKVGSTYGDAAVDAIVAGWTNGVAGVYVYLYAALNNGASAITANTVSVVSTDVLNFGASNMQFDQSVAANNLFTPISAGSDNDSRNDTNKVPVIIAGGVAPLGTANGPNHGVANNGSNLATSYIDPFTAASTLTPGLTSAIWGYTSNISPLNSANTSIVGTGSANGLVPIASTIPEPATVAMFATAIPFGLLYLKRRAAKAAPTV